MADGDTRPTVVVANPDATVCEVLARLVESAGNEAVRVTEVAQVNGAVVSAPAEAVVLDLGADTVEQLRGLRAGDHPRAADVRAVAISTGPANALLAWQAGADAVLTRPFHSAELQEAIAATIARTPDERTAERARQLLALG